MEKIVFQDEAGNDVELYIQAETRLNGFDYILVTEEDEDGAEAFILKDVSQADAEEADFVTVDDENEMKALLPLFEEFLAEDDIDLEL